MHPKLIIGLCIILLSIASFFQFNVWYISVVFLLLGVIVLLGGLGENALDMQRENDPKWDEDLRGLSDFLEHFIELSDKILSVFGIGFIILIILFGILFFGMPSLPSRF